MSAQLGLFDPGRVVPYGAGADCKSAASASVGSIPPTPTLDARFAAWVELYPNVSGLVIRELRADLTVGRRLSVKAIVEDLRNGRRVSSPHEGGFSWNNSLTSRLNRLVAQLAPDLAPHLETRRLSP